jgi:hypothetical protein
MSLLSIRRERREAHRGPHRPPRLGKLLVGAAVAVFLIWYLSQW